MSSSTRLAEILRQRRERYGITLHGSAKVLDCSRAHVIKMENVSCNPRLDLFQRIAREFCLSDAEILRVVRGR